MQAIKSNKLNKVINSALGLIKSIFEEIGEYILMLSPLDSILALGAIAFYSVEELVHGIGKLNKSIKDAKLLGDSELGKLSKGIQDFFDEKIEGVQSILKTGDGILDSIENLGLDQIGKIGSGFKELSNEFEKTQKLFMA